MSDDILTKLDNVMEKTDKILKILNKAKVLTKLFKWLRRHKRKIRVVAEICFTLGGILFSILSIFG